MIFLSCHKKGKEDKSAKFIIHDINNNKIYVKYYQKTDEMSIKNIEDSLNNVNNISSKIDNLENTMYLKNLLNILYHDNDTQVENIFLIRHIK